MLKDEIEKKWCKKKIKMRLMLIWVNISYLSPSAWDWNHHMKKKIWNSIFNNSILNDETKKTKLISKKDQNQKKKKQLTKWEPNLI